jgi:hypothetical protein
MTIKTLLTTTRSSVTCVLAFVALLSAAPARAQDTRAEVIAAKQAEKAKDAHPYVPTGLETLLARLEENFTNPRNAFYPHFGRIPRGSGFSAGIGYRYFFGPRAVFDLHGAYSIKQFSQVESVVRTPWHGNDRTVFEFKAGYLNAPRVSYFGVGMEGLGRTNFGLKQGYGSGRVDFRPTSWTRLSGELGYDGYETLGGKGSQPSIETIYDTSNTPGLFEDIPMVRVKGTAAIDSRTSPGYSRKGGYYGATLESFSDRNDVYSFQKVTAQAIQHVPILRENWVLSFRGRVESVVDDDDNVPFFLLPELGSGSTLRAYETGRFRDRHSILTSAEFRWIPNRLAMDMALFYDTGKVTSRREDLDFDGLKKDWGIGVRFHTPLATVLRVEGARGHQGWRLVFAMGGPW